jgi:hypothetical protein
MWLVSTESLQSTQPVGTNAQKIIAVGSRLVLPEVARIEAIRTSRLSEQMRTILSTSRVRRLPRRTLLQMS